jgi:hypothetical protein
MKGGDIMKKTITFDDFVDSFSKDRAATYTYEGKRALFDYLERYEEDTGEDIELDIVAICCDYTEYDDLKDLQASYPEIESIEDLENHTTVIPIEGTDRFIIQNY